MWLLAIIGLASLGVAWLAARGLVPATLGLLGLSVGVAAVLLSGWFGVRARQQALKDQEIVARRSMIVLLMAQLGHQDDTTLATIERKGGPAGEAARMILDGRAGRKPH
jgi:hypothetical protein